MNNTNITRVLTSSTLDVAYNTYLVDASAGSITLTLPLIISNGQNYTITRIGQSTNAVTVQGTSPNLIDASPTYSLGMNSSVSFQSFEYEWYSLDGLNDIVNIDLFISSLGITKSLAGLTGSVSGIASAPGAGAWVEGGGSIASGNYSHAEGVGTQSANTAAHSEGISTIASGLGSHAEGIATRAQGVGSHAEGGGNIASGDYSHAEGDPCVASGYASHAEGVGCVASGHASHAEGEGCVASAGWSHAEAYYCVASGSDSHAEGHSCTASAHGAHAEGHSCTASGLGAHAEGFGCTASSQGAHAEGWDTISSGFGSHAEGYACRATHYGAHAEDYSCVAAGIYAHAGGFESTASTDYAFAHGLKCISDQHGAVIMGTNGRTNNLSPVGAGQSTYSWSLAGGSSAPVNPGDGISILARTVTFGTPQPVGDIVTNSFTLGNADYAELFEWNDGNRNNEDRVGYFVRFVDGEKIGIANDPTNILGIVSHTSCIIGDAAELHWHGTILRDDFGRPVEKDSYLMSLGPILSKYNIGAIFPDVDKEELIRQVIDSARPIIANSFAANSSASSSFSGPSRERLPVAIKYDGNTVDEVMQHLNTELEAMRPVKTTITSTNYNDQQTYIPRSLRKEWAQVGLLGKIYVRDDGTCQAGGKCDCLNGIATAGNTWYVLRRVGTNVIVSFIVSDSSEE